MHEEEKDAVTLDTLGEKKKKLCPTFSVPANPLLWPQGGLCCPGHAGGEEEEGRGKGGLGRGTGALAGRRENGAVSVSPRAEGSAQPSLAAGGCHPHIKRPAELSPPAHSGSALPNRNRGGQGHRGVTICTLLAHTTAGGSCAASSYRGSAAARAGSGQRAHPFWSSSPSRTQPQSVLDASNPVWGPSDLSRKGKKSPDTPTFWGAWDEGLVSDTPRDACVHGGRGFLKDLILKCSVSLSLCCRFPSSTSIFLLIDN